MKMIILCAALLMSTTAFAEEVLKGKFQLDNVDYELTYTYDIPYNQVVSTQRVRIMDDVRLPEQTEPMPAFCMFDMTFPASYLVTIKKSSTQEILYKKEGTEYLSSSAYGGLVDANQCHWEVSKWSEKVSGMLRITDWSFLLNGKSYRYFMDTHLLVDARGNSDDLVVAKSTIPMKGSAGHDGEMWIDTQPTADGNYQRIWFPLSLK